VRRKVPKRAIMRIPRTFLPLKTAFVNHKKVIYIRIPGPQPGIGGNVFPMGGFGYDPYSAGDGPFGHLLVSCNDPLAVCNQLGTPQVYPGPASAINTPAFFSTILDPQQSACLFDSTGGDQGQLPATTPRVSNTYRNRYPSRWVKMIQFFDRWTCVGSKMRLTYQPNTAQAGERNQNLANPAVFICGKRNDRDIRSNELSLYPQALEEAPEYKSKQWFGRRTANAEVDNIQFNMKWSARKDMQIRRGTVLNNYDITGDSNANPTRWLLGRREYQGPDANTDSSFGSGTEVPKDASQHPGRQMYYHFCGSSGITDGEPGSPFSPSYWPAGIMRVELEYAVVWIQFWYQV